MPFEYEETELVHAISRYVREEGSLSQAELNDPETNLPTYSTVRRHYGGLKECADELGLDIDLSRGDIVDWIREDSEDGIAPKQEEFADSRVSLGPIERLFGCYKNAVFMAGKKLGSGWYRGPKDFSDEISADYLHVTRENYWDGDPEDRWETEASDRAKYLTPTQEDLPFNHSSLDAVDEDLLLPDMRIGNRGGLVDRQNQEEVMEIISEEGVEMFSDIEGEIRHRDITGNQVVKILDPESKNSYVRWMSEEEFPDNTLAMLTSKF